MGYGCTMKIESRDLCEVVTVDDDLILGNVFANIVIVKTEIIIAQRVLLNLCFPVDFLILFSQNTIIIWFLKNMHMPLLCIQPRGGFLRNRFK